MVESFDDERVLKNLASGDVQRLKTPGELFPSVDDDSTSQRRIESKFHKPVRLRTAFLSLESVPLLMLAGGEGLLPPFAGVEGRTDLLRPPPSPGWLTRVGLLLLNAGVVLGSFFMINP